MKTRDDVPWDTLLPALTAMYSTGGWTWAALAEWVQSTTGHTVTPAVINRRVSKELQHQQPRLVNPAEEPLIRRAAAIIHKKPAITTSELATAIGVTPAQMNRLLPIVHASEPGYVIAAAREAPSKYTDKDVQLALRDCSRDLGGGPISIDDYKAWRDRLKARDRDETPNAQRIINRYDGSWAAACLDAGIPANEPKRGHYDGRTYDDLVLWAAHFLRDLRETSPGMTKATQAAYTAWSKKTPGAPSRETMRQRAGSWVRLLLDAHTVEYPPTRKLPAPY